MKWTRSEIVSWVQGTSSFSEQVTFAPNTFEKNGRLRDLKDVEVSGTARYDSQEERLYVDFTVEGIMILPCSITLESVEKSFKTSETEIFTFQKALEDEDVTEVKGDTVDLNPTVYATIMAEVPWIVHKEGLKEYPKGNGWEVVREEDFADKQKDIDPRMAKILEYKEKN